MSSFLTYVTTGGLLLFGAVFIPSARAEYHPVRVTPANLETAPYNSTGLLFTEDYRGSAVVARDPRLLYTCAHVLYGDGIWSTDITFARGWNSASSPEPSQMVAVRGFRYYATYSGGDRPANFAVDFAICYRTADTSFGPVVGVYEDGGGALRSASTAKLVLGYPASLDYNDARGYYYQHRTGPFLARLTKSSGSYHTISGVTTGGGNSGGPVLANDAGTYRLAGILVSGSIVSMGVHGLNAAASTMAKNTLAALATSGSGNSPAGTSQTASSSTPLTLPDGVKTYSVRTLSLSGLPASTTATTLSLDIRTPYRGDLDVYVRSPAGRVQWVKKHASGDDAQDLLLSNTNYTSTFAGSKPNGTWSIYMRDFYKGDSATFQTASLTVTSR